MKHGVQTQNKEGKANYRKLYVDVNNPSEAEKAIEFMESLGWAYTICRLTEESAGEMKLPAVHFGNGDLFEGLDQIKRYKAAITPTASEYDQDKPTTI